MPAQKSMFVAYLLWLLLGYLGAHRFYLNHPMTALMMMGLTFVGALTYWFGLGYFMFAAVGFWLFIDLFLIPGMVRMCNSVVIVE